MGVEQFRGYVAALVAAAGVIGGAVGAAWAWMQAGQGGMTSDLALILSVFTGLIGSGSTFLFVAEGSSRATHAAERNFVSGVEAGAAMPGQAPGTTTLSTNAPTTVTTEATWPGDDSDPTAPLAGPPTP